MKKLLEKQNNPLEETTIYDQTKPISNQVTVRTQQNDKNNQQLHVLIEKHIASSSKQKYLIVVFAILIRACVSLTPYSGENNPPNFGDFECHRTWMEVTFNLPVNQWYNDTAYSNSSYWPIDYPPLCAYTHYAMAQVVYYFEPNALQLGKSHGYNNGQFRTIMRTLMIILEFIVFVPALHAFLNFYYKDTPKTQRNVYFLVILMLPSQIYIDHGHFQPNQVMHGLVIWAIYCMMKKQIALAVVFMVLAVQFKQMALYFGLPFAVYALLLILKDAKGTFIQKVTQISGRIIVLVIVFILTNLVIFLPFIQNSGIQGMLQVLIRIFPVKRGLFENNVASFWCVLHNIYKVKSIYPQETQLKLALSATVLGCIPSIYYICRTPNNKQFLLALFNVSMSFFMFSFHVHEKQILLPMLCFALSIEEFKGFYALMITYCSFSMCKLYGMDNNYMAYPPLTIGFFYFIKKLESIMLNNNSLSENNSKLIFDDQFQVIRKRDLQQHNQDYKQNINQIQCKTWLREYILNLRNYICTVAILAILAFHIIMPIFPPPPRLFDLYWAINNAMSFGVFAFISLYAHLLMHENNNTDSRQVVEGAHKVKKSQ